MSLWFIGDALDVGQAGMLLSAALRTAAIQRVDVRFETLVGVAERLNTHRPKVIVAFGNDALRLLVGDALPDDGIQALRGYFWDTPYGRVLGAMHPADIVTDWTPWRALLDIDLRRARDEVAMGAPPLDVRESITVVTRHQLDQLHHAIDVAAKAPDFLLSVDIENTQDLKLACCGFAPSVDRAWVIPANEGWQLDAIRDLCESAVPKVFQNGQYDRLFLKLHAGGIIVRNHKFDTQLAWHSINPELAGKKVQIGDKKAKSKRTAKSLKFLSSIYTRDRFWKEYAFQNEHERYDLCGKDCCVTLDIAQKQARQLEAMP